VTSWIDFSTADCPCGGKYDHHAIRISLTAEQQDELFTKVAQGVCGTCGSRVYHAETLERVESAMKRRSPDRFLNRTTLPWGSADLEEFTNKQARNRRKP